MAGRNDSWRGGGTGRGAYILEANSAGQIPVIVRGASGQTANIFVVENSAGTDLFSVDPSGNISVAGTITVTVNEAITGNVDVTGTLTVVGVSTFNGNTVIGNAQTDTLNVYARSTFHGPAAFSSDLSLTGTVLLANGTAGSPSLAFASDLNTGMFWVGADQIGWSANGVVELTLNATNLSPGANDGNALGVSGTAWADLFLASGGVINWNASTATLTESSGVLVTKTDTGHLLLGGAAQIQFRSNGTFIRENTGIELVSNSSTAFKMTRTALSSGVPLGFVYTAGAHTGMTAATEVINWNLNFNVTKTWATGAGPLATQREMLIQAPTYAGGAAALTITTASLLNIGAAIGVGSNMTITNNYILQLGGASTLGATGASMTYAAIDVPAHTLTVTGSTQVTTANSFAAVSLRQITISDASAVTVDQASTLYIANAPTGGGVGPATITNAYSIFVDAGAVRFDGRVLEAQGADVASANDLTLGSDGNTFEITGTTQINAITTTGWTLGSIVTLIFTSTPTVKNNTAGGANTAVMLLAGSSDFAATAGDTLTLRYSEQGGTNAWREVARTAI